MSAVQPTYADIFAHAEPESNWRQTAVTSLAGLLILVLFYTAVYPALAYPSVLTYQRFKDIPALLNTMASKLRMALVKTMPGQLASWRSQLSPVQKIFGLDTACLLKSPQGGGRRGFASLLSTGTGSDAPAGLGNWDNSCYQNSIIQGLASITALRDFLTSVLSRQTLSETESTNAALLATVDKLNDGSHGGRHFWLPSKLKSMSTWQQQDAQEYFSKILDQLDKEASVVLRPPSRRPGLADLLSDSESLISSEAQAPGPGIHNPLEGFIAQRVSCTGCGHSDGLSLIPFNCLTVPLGDEWRADAFRIEECLDKYTELEFIEGVECPKCTLLNNKAHLATLLETPGSGPLRPMIVERLTTVEQALTDQDFSDNTLVKKCMIAKKNWTCSTKSRQAVIARPPKALVIHVNRSIFNEITGTQMKNGSSVQFETLLNLRHWCLGSNTPPDKAYPPTEGWSMQPLESMLPSEDGADDLSPCMYELRAVVTHRGSHENGHYICYRKYLSEQSGAENGQPEQDDVSVTSKRPEERWWRLSDEFVSMVDEETVTAQGSVFMLFYEHVRHPAAAKIPADAQQESVTQSGTQPGAAADTGSTCDDEADAEQIPYGAEQESLPTSQDQFSMAVARTTPQPSPAADSDAPHRPNEDTSSIEEASEQEQHSENDSKMVSLNRQPSPVMMRTAGVYTGTQGAEKSMAPSVRMVAAT